MARRALGWSLMLLTLVLVGCDHATKFAAETTLSGGRPMALVPGLLDLRYAQNHDTAFSLTRALGSPNKAAALLVLALAATIGVVVVWWQRRLVAPRIEQVGYAFILAGALGNVIDRVVRGYVVDFIHLAHWPIFNVADVSIVLGAALLAWSAIPRPAGSSG